MKAEYQHKIVIGSDETGVGDYFTPLVAAAVRMRPDQIDELSKLNIRDSKELSSLQIDRLAELLKSKVEYAVQLMTQAQYNFLTANKKLNAHELKTLLHVKAINYLETKYGAPDLIIIDQYAAEHNFQKYLNKLQKPYELHALQAPVKLVTSGEAEHLAVAAASIIARAHLVKKMAEQNGQWNFKFPLGASGGVILAGQEFIRKHGEKALYQVAKVSFKTTKSVINNT